MNKREALDTILKCAHQYDLHLKDHNVMFIVLEKDRSLSSIEASFREANFLHLTGVTSSLNCTDFYKACIDNMLSLEQFEFKKATTDLKLQVLNQAMLIDKTAKMIGEFNNSGISLYSEKIVGNISVCMSFVKNDKIGYYVPNTVLKSDVRDKSIPPVLKIACVLKKPINSPKYELITAIGRKINIKEMNLPQDIVDKLSDRLKEMFGITVASISDREQRSPSPEETISVSKEKYNALLQSNLHMKEVIDTTNLVLNEHPKLKSDFREAKAETLGKKSQMEVGENQAPSEYKSNSHNPKR